VEGGGPCPVFASFTLAFALQLRKKGRKNLSQGKKNLSQVKKNLSQSTVYILPEHPHITKPTQTHALQPPPPPHTHYKTNKTTYKLKQTQCKIYPNEVVTI